MSGRSSAVLLAVLVLLVPSAPAVIASQAPAGRFIVVLRDADGSSRQLERAITGLTQRLSLHPTHVYRHALHGFAAALDARQLAEIRSDATVAYVAPDLPMTLTSQPLPPNFDRVNGDVAPLAHYDGMDQVSPGDGQRVDADIAILDTGVDDTHPDLNVVGGVNCAIRPTPGPSDPIPDGNPEWGDIAGHGTHVAGIAAALDNDIGIVGVAPGARIWSVRIFGRDGRGWTSNLLCGIDWVTGQRDPVDADRPLIESANMSMRVAGTDDGSCGSLNNDPVHSAICRSVAAGNVYAVAAGNERNDAEVYIPASYDEVITVSALADFDGKPGGLAPNPPDCHSNSSGVADVDDTFADFSTSGHDVDLIAPGVCVYSTFPVSKGSYHILSGTSMATPAVVGGAALYRVARPDATPEEVRAGLIAAGSRDWVRSTDPDGDPDRLLDVASAGAAADFSLVARPSVVGVHADRPASFVIEIKRSFAFTDPVALTVDGVPPGGTATFSPDIIDGPGGTDSLLTVQVADAPSGTSYPLTIHATSDGATPLERTVEVTVTVDTTPPTIRGPATRFVVGYAPIGVNVPLRITWTASDPSGPVRFELWKRVDTAGWDSLALSSPTATSTTYAVPPGHEYRFRVQGTDAAGNIRTSSSPTMTLTRRSESAPSISYKGSWPKQTLSGAYGGSLRYATAAGAQARVAFTGHAFAWLAPKGTARGQAEVIVDGRAPVVVDLHSVASVPSRVVFAIDWPESSSHIIKIRVIGTPGHPRVDLDELFTLS